LYFIVKTMVEETIASQIACWDPLKSMILFFRMPRCHLIYSSGYLGVSY
jgi:hypothetical protein